MSGHIFVNKRYFEAIIEKQRFFLATNIFQKQIELLTTINSLQQRKGYLRQRINHFNQILSANSEKILR